MIANIEPGQKLTDEYLKHLNKMVNTEENPVEYLGIDPGKANGICGYDAKYYLMFMLTIPSSEIVMFLHQFNKVKECVMEGYKVYPQAAQQHIYSDLETPRVIGRIESWAETKDIKLYTQPATVKSTGYKWIGKKPLPKSNPQNHSLDAHVHFMYWAVLRNRIKAEDLVRKNNLKCP